MTINEYVNTLGDVMVLIVDEDNNKAYSMLKSAYDEMIAQNADKL